MAILGSIGLAIIYGFKVNVSVAIVAMVNHTAVRYSAMHDELKSVNANLIITEVCQDDTISNTTTSFTEVINLPFFCLIKHTSSDKVICVRSVLENKVISREETSLSKKVGQQ